MKINETTVFIFFPCLSIIWQAWVSTIHKKSDRFHVFVIISCWHNYRRSAYYIHKVIRSITSGECMRDCCYALAVQFISYSMAKTNYFIWWDDVDVCFVPDQHTVLNFKVLAHWISSTHPIQTAFAFIPLNAACLIGEKHQRPIL